MATSEASSYIAYWGAGLSTLLALVKLWELWRDRFRIDVSYNFSGEPSNGNKIILRNLSNKPIILEYWEVLYCSGRWPRKKFQEIIYPDHVPVIKE